MTSPKPISDTPRTIAALERALRASQEMPTALEATAEAVRILANHAADLERELAAALAIPGYSAFCWKCGAAARKQEER